MNITASQVNELRKVTGAGMMDCKNALVESQGDMEKAVDYLRKKGQKVAAKRADREATEGVIVSKTSADMQYAAVIMVNCETDFVAKNEEFKKIAYDIAMHVAATNPQFLKTEDISEDVRQKTAAALASEVADKPEAMREKIMEGKLAAYFSEQVLLDQPFIKNQDITVAGLIEATVQKFGERIEIGRYTRFAIGG